MTCSLGEIAPTPIATATATERACGLRVNFSRHQGEADSHHWHRPWCEGKQLVLPVIELGRSDRQVVELAQAGDVQAILQGRTHHANPVDDAAMKID